MIILNNMALYVYGTMILAIILLTLIQWVQQLLYPKKITKALFFIQIKNKELGRKL